MGTARVEVVADRLVTAVDGCRPVGLADAASAAEPADKWRFRTPPPVSCPRRPERRAVTSTAPEAPGAAAQIW